MLYLAAYLRQALPTPRTPLLLRALFATAVGMVEPLVTRLVRQLMYRAAPQTYSSAADPKLDELARKACRGGPKEWRAALETLGVSGTGDHVDWAALGQLWQDRNSKTSSILCPTRHSSASTTRTRSRGRLITVNAGHRPPG